MKDVSIIGLGESGLAAARLVLEKGGTVYVSDSRSDPEVGARAARLRALGADVELGRHDVSRIQQSDLVVASPGIPPRAAVLVELQSRGVRWISEPELAVRFFEGPLIAVTGTNGKTTTVGLTRHLLETAGISVATGGNVGGGLAPPASDLARARKADWYLLELSSFQLAFIDELSPDIGVVTNLAPDHLDHYASVDDYYADKARLFENADASSRWVLNADDPATLTMGAGALGEHFRFSLEGPVRGAYEERGVLTLALGPAQPLIARSELPLLGRHNVANALAAAAAAGLAGAPAEAIADGLRAAPSFPHRMEPVHESGGVLWVNDSKATNVAACRGAVSSLQRPLVLLLGGKDKGEDFAALRPVLLDRARHVVVFGEAAERIAGALAAGPPLTQVQGSFEDAVTEARRRARPGDVVLLSPACSSFDMFDDYQHRGERFAALARGEA